MKNLQKALCTMLLVALCHAQTRLVSTTLSTAVSDSQTTFAVASATGIRAPTTAPGSLLFVDNEAMLVNRVQGTWITVQRGVLGTDGTPHSRSSTVWLGAFGQYATSDPSGSCIASNTAYPTINPRNATQWRCTANGSWAQMISTFTAKQRRAVYQANQYCKTPGTLDQSCITNALGANRTIVVPAGSYSIRSTLTISQNDVTIQCQPNAILQAANTGMKVEINVVGTGDTITGCIIDNDNTPIGGGTSTVSVTGNNFTFTGNTIQNSQNYSIEASNITGAEISLNTLALYANSALSTPGIVFFASKHVRVHNNTINGYVGVYTTGSGQVSSGTVVANNIVNEAGNGQPLIGGLVGFCIVFQSTAPVGTASITNFSITGNTCNIRGTTNSIPGAGGFSIVLDTYNGTIAGNKINANNQYINIAGIESSCANCTITGNTLNMTDAGFESYDGIVHYAGQTTISGNRVKGWGNANGGQGIRLYPQTNGDNNVVSGNIVVNTNQTSGDNANYAINVACNVRGESAKNIWIVGNIISIGVNGRGISTQDATSGSCPSSEVIDENAIAGSPSAYGIFVHYTTVTIGANPMVGVRTPFLSSGVSVTINR